MSNIRDDHGAGGEAPVVKTQPTQPVYGKKNWWRKVNELLVKWGPALTVVALFLSIFQVFQAIWGASDIKRIASSVSTQYVDVFPKNMPEIINLINSTEDSLTIITDVAAYGHFTSPAASAEYVEALKKLNWPTKNIKIEILCYDRTKGTDKLRDQFKTAFTNFETYRNNNKETFETYARWHNGKAPESDNEIIMAVMDAGDEMLRSLRSNAQTKVITTPHDMPIFMWIRDGKEAIFSLHNYGQSPREDSFRTTDERFIARLKDIAKADFLKAGHPPAAPPAQTAPVGEPAQPSPTPSAPTVPTPSR